MSKDYYKKLRRNKTTEAMKHEIFARSILKSLNWNGTHTLWPYKWDGWTRMARIKSDALFKAIEWDLVYDPPDPPLPLELLDKLVDNGTTVVTIPTPKGWKCDRKGCKADYLHSHGTYSTLKKKA